jgi:hypothetical protein
MPHTTRKRKPTGERKTPAKPRQAPAKVQRTVALGERNPDTLPDGTQARESHADNERGTRRWARIRKEVMAVGSGNHHYTGWGNT